MDFRAIYRQHAREYDEGTGTGRIARLLAGKAMRLIGVEREPAMLEVARGHLERSGRRNWELDCADARASGRFGAGRPRRGRERGWPRVPECTGLSWRRRESK